MRYPRGTEMVPGIMDDSSWKIRTEVVKRMTESWEESRWERRTEVIKSMRKVETLGLRKIEALGRRLEVKL